MFERNNDLERKQLAPGVCITTLDASKFNRCRITLHLRFPAKRESATDAAVLALVLERGYAACPDMTALSRRLAELYGADLGVDLASAGTDRVLSADICGIKDAYALAGENLTAAYADIVFGTIFDPPSSTRSVSTACGRPAANSTATPPRASSWAVTPASLSM